MKKIFLNLILIFFTTLSFAQVNKSEQIETSIKNIIRNNTFTPESTNGVMLNEKGQQISFNTSFYYFLDSEKLFSVLYEQHDEISLNKTFYYDNDQLVLVVIERVNNKSTKDRIIEQVFYFYDNGNLIDSSDYTAKYVPTDLYSEGMKYYTDFN